MIPVPSGVRVWLAVGHTDMRRGMNGLALQVQQALGRDPHAGDLYVFRGRRADLVKIVWHDGIGMSLYAKRLERGRFISYGLCQPLWSCVIDRLMGWRYSSRCTRSA
ncbi:IS66 family insertion sequence element accessory protein TnpB [Falsiroseomonas sp.]|uniref:IS66 family insertion sequence element accessory protein TnpB n=1 Tax=Falsiroseomonas sp. TaxID=2870721 RepID=UPI003F72AC82